MNARSLVVRSEHVVLDTCIFVLTTARDYMPRKTRVFVEGLRAHLEAHGYGAGITP